MEKTRPQNVLGALIVEPELRASVDIGRSFFRTERQQAIFDEIEKGAADMTVIIQRVREKYPKFDDVYSYVTECTDGVHRMTPAGLQQLIDDEKKSRVKLKIEGELKEKIVDHEKMKRLYQELERLDSSATGKRPKAETLKEFLSRDIPERKTLIEPILGMQEMTMIHGRPKIGKSLLSLQIARCLVTGESWLGFKVSKLGRPILIIQVEIAEALMQDRVRKIFGDIEESESIIIPSQTRNIFLDQKAGRNEAKCLIEDYKPGGVILDPYYKLFTDEEAAFKNPRPFFDFWFEQIEVHNLTLIFIHHDAKFQEGKLGGQKALGSTAINASTDGNWNIERILDAELTPEEFSRTARLSFESRNWQNIRPIDIRLGNDLKFEAITIPKSKANEWDILKLVEEAGGEIEQKELIKHFSSTRGFYQAKDKAIERGLIDEVKLENVRGQPIMLMLKNGGTQ